MRTYEYFGKTKKEYDRLHKWVRKNKVRTGICLGCEQRTNTEWSNISGEYKEDLLDWQEACIACHADYDAEMRFDLGLNYAGRRGKDKRKRKPGSGGKERPLPTNFKSIIPS